MTASWFGLGLKSVANGSVDLDTDTVKATLHLSTYVPNVDTHDFRDDATNEITGVGYTAGGVTLTTKTLTYDAGTNELRWDADDVSWTSASFTARILVLSKSRGGAATADELISWVDFGADETVASGTFTVAWSATGIAKITAT